MQEHIITSSVGVGPLNFGMDSPRKYNEAMPEMLEYFECLEKRITEIVPEP